MKTLSSLFYAITWLIYITVILLNILGVVFVPWNVAITPLVIGAVQMLAIGVFYMSKKEELEKAVKQQIDKKVKELEAEEKD